MLKPSFSDVAGPNRNWVRNGQIQELNLSINWHVGRKEQTTTTFLKDFRDPVPVPFKSMLLCKDEVIIHMSVHFFMQTCLFSVENLVQGAHKDIAWHRTSGQRVALPSPHIIVNHNTALYKLQQFFMGEVVKKVLNINTKCHTLPCIVTFGLRQHGKIELNSTSREVKVKKSRVFIRALGQNPEIGFWTNVWAALASKNEFCILIVKLNCISEQALQLLRCVKARNFLKIMIVPIRCVLWKNLVNQCLDTCISYLYQQKPVQYLNWPAMKKIYEKLFQHSSLSPGCHF